MKRYYARMAIVGLALLFAAPAVSVQSVAEKASSKSGFEVAKKKKRCPIKRAIRRIFRWGKFMESPTGGDDTAIV